VDQLVGAVEIAERLGVGKSSVVHDWRYRHSDFPEPVAKVGSVFIWVWPDVEEWAKQTGRLK
jgi:predicted DNA-binding transcriptional regulator AlpA